MPEATRPLTHRPVVTRTTFRQQVLSSEPDWQHMAHAVLNAVIDGPTHRLASIDRGTVRYGDRCSVVSDEAAVFGRR
jgi:hypothetical protein